MKNFHPAAAAVPALVAFLLFSGCSPITRMHSDPEASPTASLFREYGIHESAPTTVPAGAVRAPYTLGCTRGNREQGVYEKWDKNGTLVVQQKYHQGKPDSIHTTWYGTGQLLSRKVYDQGVPAGTWEEWYDNGNRRTTINYQDGRLHGKWKAWFKNGQLERSVEYRHGKPYGIWKTWDRAGTLIDSREYGKNGYRCGTWVYRNPNGTLKEYMKYDKAGQLLKRKSWHPGGWQAIVGNYKNGIRHGIWKSWLHNGKLRYSLKYDMGHRTGTWKTWISSGDLYEVAAFRKDQRHGTWKSFHNNGRIKKVERYKNGQRHGIWKEYFETGGISCQAKYSSDSLIYCWKRGHLRMPKEYDGNYVPSATPDAQRWKIRFNNTLEGAADIPPELPEIPDQDLPDRIWQAIMTGPFDRTFDVHFKKLEKDQPIQCVRIIRAALKDSSLQVRKRAEYAGKKLSYLSFQVLLDKLFADDDPGVRIKALELLIVKAPDNADKYWGQAFNDRDSVVRDTIFQAVLNSTGLNDKEIPLEQFPSGAFYSIMDTLFADNDPEVRIRALDLLQARDPLEVMKYWHRGFKDPVEAVRDATLQALMRNKNDPQYVLLMLLSEEVPRLQALKYLSTTYFDRMGFAPSVICTRFMKMASPDLRRRTLAAVNRGYGIPNDYWPYMRDCFSETCRKCGNRLYSAVLKGDSDLVRTMLEQGIDPNMFPDYRDWLPLHASLSMGHFDIAAMLIEYGADLNCIGLGNNCISAMRYTVRVDSVESARFLLENGVRVGVDALLEAASRRNSDMVQLFLKSGVSSSVVDSFFTGTISSSPVSIIVRLFKYTTPEKRPGIARHIFPTAISSNWYALIPALVDAGIDLNQSTIPFRNNRLTTPIVHATLLGNHAMVDILLKHGADPGEAIDHAASVKMALKLLPLTGREFSWSPALFRRLQSAARDNERDIARELLRVTPPDFSSTKYDTGPLYRAIGEYGISPLILAIQSGHYDMVKLLIDHGADINFRWQVGTYEGYRTPLEVAEENGRSEITELLKRNGAHK